MGVNYQGKEIEKSLILEKSLSDSISRNIFRRQKKKN